MRIAIIKYNAGNTASVAGALRRIGAEAVVTDVEEDLRQADRVIFPGVGEASTAMRYLRTRGLDDTIRSLSQPVLGICLGMQLMCAFSEENSTECLGIIPCRVRRFESGTYKVPHMGWNTIREMKSRLFTGIADGSHVYFVHGYFVEKTVTTTATTEYIEEFSAGVEYNNFYAVQFHPEKSGEVGARILENFLKL